MDFEAFKQEIARETNRAIREAIGGLRIVDFAEVKSVQKLANGGNQAKVRMAGASQDTTWLNCLVHYIPVVGEWVMIVYPPGSAPVIIGEAPAKENTIQTDADLYEKKTGYRAKQTLLYAQFYRNLRKGVPQKICAMGDSVTYGHDTVSADIRPADPTILPNGSTHTVTRASITYPEALQTFLSQVYGSGDVTVINRGYSGDGTQLAYNRWITSSGANLTTINLGINDSRATWVPYNGDLSVFLQYYRLLIERELDWNSAVIILTPSKMRKANDIDVDTFSNALQDLGREYNIPVIETDEFMANYGADCYSDATHLNGKGYNIYGAKLAAIFIGEGAHKPMKVQNGMTLLTRPTLDNVYLMSGATFGSSTGYPTPAEDVSGQGVGINFADNGSLIYSFYAESNDIVVLPSFYADSDTVNYDLILDFGVEQPDYSMDYRFGYGNSNFSTKPLSTVNFPKTVFPFTFGTGKIFNSAFFNNMTLPNLMISAKGWHTVKIVARKLTGLAFYHGMDFYNYETLKRKVSVTPSYYLFQTHALYNDTTVVNSSVVNLDTITSALGITISEDYWLNPVFRVTVQNFDESILEYLIQPGGRTSNAAKWILGLDVRETKLKATPTLVRTLGSVSYDTVSKNLTLSWAGATGRATNIKITVV